MDDVRAYLPTKINSGAFLTAYSLPRLQQKIDGERVVLPICSLGESVERLRDLAPLVLPPLYHEALDADLKGKLIERVTTCFPYHQGTARRSAWTGSLEVIELPRASLKPPGDSPRIVSFSFDTAVEEHGPHLPLMTDTIQSYGVLLQLEEELRDFVAGPPGEYGQLTWGLPFGMSVDITPPLLTRYVAGFARAVAEWMRPTGLYVVDVHGSIVHRNAIQDGLRQSGFPTWSFRWLHEPLVEFAGERGDQHAGGVETALVERIGAELIDRGEFPAREARIASGQMEMQQAIELSADLPEFLRQAEANPEWNGIVGDIGNYHHVDAELMFQRMLDVARQDVAKLT